MYICVECFAEYRSPQYECEECGGVVEETWLCDCCEERIKGRYILINNGLIYCDHCYSKKSI